MRPHDGLARAIAGALRSQIRDHGPITPDWIGSTVKRILGQIPNAAASALGSALVAKRWAGKSTEQRAAALPWLTAKARRKAGRAAWAGMTKAQIRAEMRRRAAVRKARAVLSSSRRG